MKVITATLVFASMALPTAFAACCTTYPEGQSYCDALANGGGNVPKDVNKYPLCCDKNTAVDCSDKGTYRRSHPEYIETAKAHSSFLELNIANVPLLLARLRFLLSKIKKKSLGDRNRFAEEYGDDDDYGFENLGLALYRYRTPLPSTCFHLPYLVSNAHTVKPTHFYNMKVITGTLLFALTALPTAFAVCCTQYPEGQDYCNAVAAGNNGEAPADLNKYPLCCNAHNEQLNCEDNGTYKLSYSKYYRPSPLDRSRRGIVH
ncbi:hypothetical protein CERZMDRAFT_100800 [Cercospora zeae-maydis SCOH1-5]|uniref:Uncharacterized protein n=1 Tax=Cercospora zeae-maydis SCOH1-5 TaxID=717836 RepID=A0A6A6F5N0_9PEZI|nr:hypothetical protein CERZMDRAFT_100800 [Cercospora zeae-maydis SCOH1-5]